MRQWVEAKITKTNTNKQQQQKPLELRVLAALAENPALVPSTHPHDRSLCLEETNKKSLRQEDCFEFNISLAGLYSEFQPELKYSKASFPGSRRGSVG